MTNELSQAELAMLMLCCDLGDPESVPLTTVQFRNLSQRWTQAGAVFPDLERSLKEDDLLDLGYDRDFAARVLTLLDRRFRLEKFLKDCSWRGITILTRISENYPKQIAQFRLNAPPVLLCAGDLTLFSQKAVALVGSRQLEEPGRTFARRVGRLAADEGLTLVSGGAQGADWEAQMACWEQGGRMILYPADSLKQRLTAFRGYVRRGVLLLCAESSADAPFTAARAANRNRLIHRTGDRVFVAQAAYKTGGTWSGTRENLRGHWTPVYANAQGGPGCQALASLGATLVGPDYIQDYICSRVIAD